MATLSYPIGGIGDPNVDPCCFVNILYNDATGAKPLLITGIQFKNTMPLNCTVTWNSRSVTLPSGTPLSVIDVSSRNEHMLPVTNFHGVQTVQVPGGEVDFSYGG